MGQRQDSGGICRSPAWRTLAPAPTHAQTYVASVEAGGLCRLLATAARSQSAWPCRLARFYGMLRLCPLQTLHAPLSHPVFTPLFHTLHTLPKALEFGGAKCRIGKLPIERLHLGRIPEPTPLWGRMQSVRLAPHGSGCLLVTHWPHASEAWILARVVGTLRPPHLNFSAQAKCSVEQVIPMTDGAAC